MTDSPTIVAPGGGKMAGLGLINFVYGERVPLRETLSGIYSLSPSRDSAWSSLNWSVSRAVFCAIGGRTSNVFPAPWDRVKAALDRVFVGFPEEMRDEEGELAVLAIRVLASLADISQRAWKKGENGNAAFAWLDPDISVSSPLLLRRVLTEVVNAARASAPRLRFFIGSSRPAVPRALLQATAEADLIPYFRAFRVWRTAEGALAFSPAQNAAAFERSFFDAQ